MDSLDWFISVPGPYIADGFFIILTFIGCLPLLSVISIITGIAPDRRGEVPHQEEV